LENRQLPGRNPQPSTTDDSATIRNESHLLSWLKSKITGKKNGGPKGEPSNQPRFSNVWINREAGSGSDIIARQVAARLNWTVYNEEFIEIISRRMKISPEMIRTLDELAPGMIQDWLLPLREQHYAPQENYFEHLDHLIQEIGSLGSAVIVGRGAGFVLPAESTLRVRLIAPLPNRTGRLADRMGVSPRTAKRAARDLDRRRKQFDWALYRKDSDDPHHYHMTLDTNALGLSLCSDMITLAVLKGIPAGQSSGGRVVNIEPRPAGSQEITIISDSPSAPLK
jgi:cytidylate kinase